MARERDLVAVAALLLAPLGCTATITLADGRKVEGCVLGADPQGLYVSPVPPRPPEVIATSCDAPPVRLDHVAVREVNHPGGAVMGLGIVMMATSAIMFSAAFAVLDESTFVPVAATSAGLSTAGVAIMSVGFWTWGRSNAAATIPPPLPTMGTPPPAMGTPPPAMGPLPCAPGQPTAPPAGPAPPLSP